MPSDKDAWRKRYRQSNGRFRYDHKENAYDPYYHPAMLAHTACLDVCPVECMILGQPKPEWPWLYIDPDTCIDGGACVPECPYEAIFPEEEVPFAYEAPPGIWINDTKELLPDGQPFAGEVDGHPVKLLNAKQLQGGEILDLTEDIPPNYDFFSEGPGYDALDM